MPSTWPNSIEITKKRLYTVVLPLGTLSSSALFVLERHNGNLHIVDALGLPLFALVCLGLLFGVNRWPQHLHTYEVTLFGVFTLLYVASLGYSMATFTDQPSSIWNLVGLNYWGPVLYTLAFLVFGVQRGLWVSLSIHSLFVFATLNYLAAPLEGAVTGTGEMLLQGTAAGGITLLLLTAVGRVVADQVRAAAQLEYDANTDPLTHLSNRRQIRALLEREAARVERQGGTFSLAFLDIDHFKTINDAHGHEVGDEVLVALGALLKGQIRALDVIGRWGGEEFLLLLPGLTLHEAREAVERLRLVVAERRFGPLGGLTLSAGVAQYRVDEPLEVSLQRADRALYRAKAEGRNQVATELDPQVFQRAPGDQLN